MLHENITQIQKTVNANGDTFQQLKQSLAHKEFWDQLAVYQMSLKAQINKLVFD